MSETELQKENFIMSGDAFAFPTKYADALITLFNKYKDDQYMLAKMDNLVTHQLQVMLENIDKSRAEREQRIEELTQEQDQFINTFFSKYRYFYVQSADHFFLYDGVHYNHVSEDEVLHNILSSISRDRSCLMTWKYKTKSVIMKRIRENLIQTCIPESGTIQTVLNALYPTYFASKAEAKYFLTVLGDNILKTQQSLLHIISSEAKSFLDVLNFSSRIMFGTSLNQTFKYKCHADHPYSALRLLNYNYSGDSKEGNAHRLWIQGPVGLDLLCVACHYSYRYGSADLYLEKYSNNDTVLNHVMYLCNQSSQQLVEQFIGEYLTKNPAEIGANDLQKSGLDWKNMQYLWKHFLSSKDLPNPVSLAQFKMCLMQALSDFYIVDADHFVGINSRYLPSVKLFLKFWNDTMIIDNSEIELEISEIAFLYKKWNNNQTQLSELQITNIIGHFFPEIEVDEGKYVYKVRCSLWDKQTDIMTALADIPVEQTVSIHDAYAHYCDYYKTHIVQEQKTPNNEENNKKKSDLLSLVASKQYFEKYLAVMGDTRFTV